MLLFIIEASAKTYVTYFLFWVPWVSAPTTHYLLLLLASSLASSIFIIVEPRHKKSQIIHNNTNQYASYTLSAKPVYQVLSKISMENSVTSNLVRKTFHAGPFELSSWNGWEFTQNQLVLCGTRSRDSQCQPITLNICTEFYNIMTKLNLKFCWLWPCKF